MDISQLIAGRAHKILAIDPEGSLASGLRSFLDRRYVVTSAPSWTDGRRILEIEPFDVLLICSLSGDEESALRMVKEAAGSCCSYLSIILAVEAPDRRINTGAARDGADDIIARSDGFAEMERIIGGAVQRNLARKMMDAKRADDCRMLMDPVFGSPAMRKVLEKAARFMDSGENILIAGEAGSGKGVLARWIHEESNRREAPFETVDPCSAGPDLLGPLLFGVCGGGGSHPRGRKPGLLEMVDGGTMVFRRIERIDPAMQEKMLALLEKRPFRSISGAFGINVDVRYICLSRGSDPGAPRGGSPAEDALCGHFGKCVIGMPALRERREDIPELAGNILKRLREEYDRPEVAGISPGLMSRMLEYDWPGNFLELAEFVRRTLMSAEGEVLEKGTFFPDYPAARIGSVPWRPEAGFEEAVKRAKKEIVSGALERASGKVSEAARLLKKRREVVYHLCKDLSIDPGMYRKRKRRSGGSRKQQNGAIPGRPKTPLKVVS